MSLNQAIEDYLQDINQKGLLRSRTLTNTSDLYFDSNDYLSLAQDKKLAKAYQKGFDLYPHGSGGSMLVCGYHEAHQRVEQAFAQWLGVDECVLFSSGFSANLALTALLGQLKTSCLIDKAVHASIYDGLALSGVSYVRYKHVDMSDLSLKLKENPSHKALLTEGVFSMGGQITPLSALYSLCQAKEVTVFLDEAHSIGVLGPQGKGLVAAEGFSQKEVPLRMLPLGKAFASSGAIVAGQTKWISALLQAGRSLIYSTAMSPAFCEGLLRSLELVTVSEDRRQTLAANIQHFKDSICNSPLQWANSITPIQQLQLGCPQLALHYALVLKKQGIRCTAMRQPTVSKKASGLRVVLNYSHTFEQINQLIEAIHCIHERTL